MLRSIMWKWYMTEVNQFFGTPRRSNATCVSRLLLGGFVICKTKERIIIRITNKYYICFVWHTHTRLLHFCKSLQFVVCLTKTNAEVIANLNIDTFGNARRMEHHYCVNETTGRPFTTLKGCYNLQASQNLVTNI